MSYFIGGSTVLQFFLPQYSITPSDLDIFYFDSQPLNIQSRVRIEYHEIPNKELFDAFIIDSSTKLLTLESLYTLKLSHAEYNIKWLKTVQHIRLLKKHITPLDDRYQRLFQLLKEHWATVHYDLKNHITLKKSATDFFTDKVKRKFDHDYLHEIMSYNKQPMYKNCLKDGQNVLLDENKFNKLSFENKLQLCREEIFVIALERFLIPTNYEMGEHEAYRKAIKKVVTQMTKGWFPTFICENYDILHKFDVNYYNLFRQKISQL